MGTELWHGGLVSGGSTRRWSVELLQAMAVLADVVLVAGGAVVAWGIFGWFKGSWPLWDRTQEVGLVAAMMFVVFMAARGGYSIARLVEARRQALMALQAWGFAFFMLAWVAFLFKATDDFSRGMVTVYFVLGGLVVPVAHGIGALVFAQRFASGTLSHSRVAVIAVADTGGADRIVRRLSARGVEVTSVSAISPARIGRTGFMGACREAVGDVRTALAATKLDGIYLFLSWKERRRIDEIKSALSSIPVPVFLFADSDTERLLRRTQVNVGPFVGFELQRAPLSRFDRAAKRLLDIVVAVTALVVLSPLMLMTATAIAAESGLPVLFRQHRKGFGARPFQILKFRSMSVMENGTEVKQATKGDARITRIGRVIRRTSIDELPQLVNVLRGDMSIVGPRPHAIAHDDHYDKLIASYAFRQHVKPGITGWAQVNGCRGETQGVDQMKARVEHDIWYINNWSIWLDMRIILTTAVRIFFDKQAY